MVEDSSRDNIMTIINPLLTEDFWHPDNINIELDYNEGIFSLGKIEIEKFSVQNTQLIIEELVLSIIKGEYLFENTLIYLKDLLRHIEEIRRNSLYFEQENLKFKQKYFNDNFIVPLKFCLTRYISSIIHIKNIINLDNVEYIFEYNSDDEDDIYSSSDVEKDIFKWIQLFLFYNVVLNIEFSFSIEDNDYKRLYRISTELNINDYHPTYKNILKQRCDFLRYKWVIRRKTHGKTVKYLKDGIFVEPNFNDEMRSNSFILKWEEDIRFHYTEGLIGSEERFRSRYLSLKNKNLNELNLYELHQLIKYAKDFKKDYSLLCSYVDEIGRREVVLNNSDYERYIFKKAYNYALNNKFSFLVKIDGISLEKVRELYDFIKSFQSRHEVNNFFVNYKYLEFIVERIKDFDDSLSEDYVKNTKDYFSLAQVIIDNNKLDIEWSRKNLIFLYHFEYENSIVQISDIPVFIASNYQLPLSSSKYLKDFNLLRLKFSTLNDKFRVYKEIEPHVQRVKELERKDLRDLERLS